MEEINLNEDVRPSIHPFASVKVEELFSRGEKSIVNAFSSQWYVTKVDEIKIGASDYKYMLLKAPANIANLFNLSAELIAIFSEYEKLEPRTFDAFDYVKNILETGRVENLCGILISKDNNVENAIRTYTDGKETRIIVPFSYDEIHSGRTDSYLFRNKLQKYFYNRDLFAFDDALKTDLYFFGRNQLVLDIINSHLAGQNTGLFGLRKTGKTSIIFDVRRKIKLKNAMAVFISCQNPGMSEGTWLDSIYYVIRCIYDEMEWDKAQINRNNINEISASELLVQTISEVYNENGCTTLLMFDEIEHITYKKASDDRWGKGRESVSFWKAIRSAFQQEQSKFTYCIVGTNPVCIEYHTIENADNPIFYGVKPLYIPGFDVNQTREMVRKLGRIMGIKFDEPIYAKMTEEYGGHPFLIRHVCSYIAENYPNRPVFIDRKKYQPCSDKFKKTQGKYFDMLLDVLKEFYPMEYEMLQLLAKGDEETFNYFAEADYSMIQHLIGYGIIRRTDDYFDFQMDVIKEYLLVKERLSVKLETVEAKWSHLCTRRGDFEIGLRKLVKQVILITFSFNDKDAKDYVMSKVYNDKDSRRKYASYTYSDLFDPKKSLIFLKNLTTLILSKWDIFSQFMGELTQQDFMNLMGILNDEGRFDAHAKTVSNRDIVLFDAAIDKLEVILKTYKDMMEN